MLLIYRLNPTFVVTVLTTIFVSDFPLLTKVLTVFFTTFPQPLLSALWRPIENKRSYSLLSHLEDCQKNSTKPPSGLTIQTLYHL